MIGLTIAIFVDAYRELNAKRMFWIVLTLSGLVVAAFAVIGINSQGLTAFGYEWPTVFNTNLVSEPDFYKLLFAGLGVDYWLGWVGATLALVSTASIFPDLITGGSIDLYLSKPIGRLRLFVTKYAAGLLFVTLQVTVFCVAAFLMIGFRAGTWAPAIFLAVPLVVCFFSYLFAVCVLVGILTRSTLSALLITILFWCFLFGLHQLEVKTLTESVKRDQAIARVDRKVAKAKADLTFLEDPATAPDDATILGERLAAAKLRLAATQRERQKMTNTLATPHRILLAVKTPLPKTAETVEMLRRWLVESPRLRSPITDDDADRRVGPFGQTGAKVIAREETERVKQSRSAAWIIGTSLAFEAVVLSLAALIFCRRDY